MPTPIVQVTTTAPSEEVADTLSAALVEGHLAACVQVTGPIRSRYRWQGDVETATEWQVVAKTTAAAADAVVARIVELHPYDMPEVLVTPVLDGADGYLAWVAGEVRGT